MENSDHAMESMYVDPSMPPPVALPNKRIEGEDSKREQIGATRTATNVDSVQQFAEVRLTNGHFCWRVECCAA